MSGRDAWRIKLLQALPDFSRLEMKSKENYVSQVYVLPAVQQNSRKIWNRGPWSCSLGSNIPSKGYGENR